MFTLANFSKDFSNLESLDLSEVIEVVDISMDILDYIWKQNDFPEYPQKRMIHVFDTFGGSIGRYIQKKFSTVDIWGTKFSEMKEKLQYAIQICEKWVNVCETLTEKFWRFYHSHRWEDERYYPNNLMKLCDRFKEVSKLLLDYGIFLIQCGLNSIMML